MKFTLTKLNDEFNVAIQGDVNEQCEKDFKELLSKIAGPKVSFDLEHVEHINSVGAVQWFQFNQELAKKIPNIVIRNCSVAFVECCNIYKKVAPPQSIVSLFVPAQCDQCGDESLVLCEAQQLKQDLNLPTTACKSCKSIIAPQVDLTEYIQCLED